MKMGPTFFENKCILTFFLGLLSIFVLMDCYLWLIMIPNSAGPLPLNFNTSSNPCTQRSPFCVVAVKDLMMDWMNFYVHIPLSVLFNQECHFSTIFYFISANSISAAHVVAAALAARLVAHDSLCMRRLGVLLFELRNFLDALDGTVARARRGPQKPEETFTSIGYYVDGVTDGLGCALLLFGCWAYLKNHPLKKNSLYSPLPTAWTDQKTHEKETSHASFCLSRLTFSIRNKVCKSSHLPFWLGFQWFINSSAWNRYITNFTFLVETSTPVQSQMLQDKKAIFCRRTVTYITLICWRLINVHAASELLLVSIFFDKLGEFLAIMHFFGWTLIFMGIFMGELLLQEAKYLLI